MYVFVYLHVSNASLNLITIYVEKKFTNTHCQNLKSNIYVK